MSRQASAIPKTARKRRTPSGRDGSWRRSGFDGSGLRAPEAGALLLPPAASSQEDINHGAQAEEEGEDAVGEILDDPDGDHQGEIAPGAVEAERQLLQEDG